MFCPCGSQVSYEQCCKLYIEEGALPATAEKLMRSRYTAFTMAQIDYLKTTLAPESRKDFDAQSTRDWAKNSDWKGLKILSTSKGTETDNSGVVEFIASFEHDQEVIEHHEFSQFRKDNSGQWFFVDGDSHQHKAGEDPHHHHRKPQTFIRDEEKIGRNDPCHCGSGKKFKKCHGA